MASAADRIDSTPMANLLTQLVMSPGDMAQMAALGRGISGRGSDSSSHASESSSIFGTITNAVKEAMVGQEISPVRQPVQQASTEVSRGELSTLDAPQFRGVQAPQRSAGMGMNV